MQEQDPLSARSASSNSQADVILPCFIHVGHIRSYSMQIRLNTYESKQLLRTKNLLNRSKLYGPKDFSIFSQILPTGITFLVGASE